MHFDEKGYNLLRNVIVLSWLGIALVLISGLVLYNEYAAFDNTTSTVLSSGISLGFCAVMFLFMLFLQVVARPRYMQQREIRALIDKMLDLLADEVQTTKTFPGLDGAVIVATKTEGPYLYDIEVRPARGLVSSWEITRYRINSKDNLRDPISVREMSYVTQVYEAMRAPTWLRDEQARRATTIEARRHETVVDSSDQSHVTSTHS